MPSSLRYDVFHQMEKRWFGTEYLNGGYLDAGGKGGQHVVQFYGHDAELAERVADYLLGALDRDGAAIVIASPEHRNAFEARLTKAGADLDSGPRTRCLCGPGLARNATRVQRHQPARPGRL